MFKCKPILLIFILLLSFAIPAYSQTKKEKELTKTADKLFDDQEYVQAEKIYSQLLSSNVENPEFNYKYGACLLQTSDKKTDALKYLQFAVSKSTEVNESYFYLARAFHISYQFDKAIEYYNKFKSSLKEKDLKKYDLDLYITECNKGKELIKDFRQVKVIDAKKMRRPQFYRGYKLGRLDSKILLKPDEFTTKEDALAKTTEPQLVVNGSEDDVLFFTGYKYGSKFGKLDLDIFMVEKLEDGTWSGIKDLGPFINTDFDDAYPYLHPNGLTLFFASKGHGGLGGYDLYKSQLDTVTNQWGKPINLGFSINSPFDDILYLVDAEENAAFFASDRQNKLGEITVYKIIPPKKEDNFVLVKGEVKVEGASHNFTKIDVISSLTGEFIARYESNRKTGRFIFPLAELESYELEFTFADSLKQKTKLTLPSKNVKDIVYQHITIKVPADLSQPALIELTEDETYKATDEDKLAAIDQMSALEENQISDVKFAPNSTKRKKRKRKTSPTMTVDTVPKVQSPEELLTNAQQELAGIEEKKELMSKQINAAYVMAEKKNTLVSGIQDELDVLIESSEEGGYSQDEKALILDKEAELDNAIQATNSALDYAKNQESNYLIKEKEEQLLTSYIGALELANSSGNSDAAISKLIQHQKEMDKIQQELSLVNKEDNLDQLKRNVVSTKNDRSTIEKKLTKIKSDLALMEEEKKLLNQQIESTRKKSIKEELNLQLTELAVEEQKKKEELTQVEKQFKAVNNQLEKMAEQLALFDDIEISSTNENIAITDKETRDAIITSVNTIVNRKNETDTKLIQSGIDKNELIANSSVGKKEIANQQNTTSSKVNSINNPDAVVENDDLSEEEKNIEDVKDDDQGNSESDELAVKSTTSSTASNENINANNNDNEIDNSQEIKESELVDSNQIATNDAENKEDTKESAGSNNSENQNDSLNEETSSSEEEEQLATRITEESNIETITDTNTTEKSIVSNKSSEVFKASKINTAVAYELLATSIGNLTEDELKQLSTKVFNYPSSAIKNNENTRIKQYESDYQDKLNQALAIQQIIEKKKKDYDEESTVKSKEEIASQISSLERQLVSIKDNAVEAQRKANNEEFNKKKEALDLSLFVDPNLETDEIAAYQNDVRSLWMSAQNKSKQKNSSISQEEVNQLGKEILELEAQAILKQEELEQLVLNQQKNTQSEDINANLNSTEINSDTSTDKESITTDDTEINASQNPISTPQSNDEKEIIVENENNSNSEETNLIPTDVVENNNSVVQTAQDGIDESLRSNYKSKAIAMLKEAENSTDVQVQQELFEKAALYEQASSPERLAELQEEVETELTNYNEADAFIQSAKTNLNKNETSLEALELEQKAYDLYTKAEEKKKAALLENDPIKRINTLNEVKEVVAYASLKQKEAREKYIASSRTDADPQLANKSFEVLKTTESATENNEVFVAATKDNTTNQLATSNETINKNTTTSEVTEVDTNTLVSDSEQTNRTINNDQEEGNEISNTDAADNSNPEYNSTGLNNAESTSSSTTSNTTNNSNIQAAYARLIKEAEAIEAKEAERKEQIEQLNFLAKTNRTKSEQTLAAVQQLSDVNEIQKKLDEANTYREQAENREVEAKKEEYYMVNNLAEAKAKRQEAALIIGSVNEETGVVASNNPLNLPDLSYEDEGRGTYSSNTAYVKEGLKITPSARYNSRTKIPVDVLLPPGLVYKVQVGAFRNKINPKIFNGISPLTGEKTASGIIRYTAGLFVSFKAADMAKGRIRNLGYSDAFVVVFYNGKRISIEEAENIRNQSNEKEKEAYTKAKEDEVEKLKKAGIREEEAFVTTSNRPNPIDGSINGSINGNEQAPTTTNNLDENASLNNVTGIYYTVQVGVYSTPKTSADLFNVSPLNTFKTSNGNIRYSTGVYRNLTDAISRRNEVRNNGITDAYVVAYQNGQRITVEQANGVSSNNNTDEQATVSEITNSQTTNSQTTSGIIFKVQIGVFKTPINLSTNSSMRNLEPLGIEVTTTSTGLLIYTVGSVNSKEEADKLRENAVSSGIIDAFVVAFKDGKKITVQSAMELIR